MDLLKVEQELCLRQRVKHHECRRCVEACPKQAIRVDAATSAITVEAHCNQCGICVRHCPAQAVRWHDTKRYPLRSEHGEVELYCQKLKCDGYVSCLANISEFELVYLGLQADIYVCMDEALCKQCAINMEDEVQILLRKANAFLAKIDGGQIKLRRKDQRAAEQMKRRDLFGFLFTKMRQSVIEALPIATEVTDYRGLLLAALKGRQAAKDLDAAPLFWGMRVKNCTMCGICVKLCRQDALRIEMDANENVSRLMHDQSRCIGCGACQTICARDALRLAAEHSSLWRIIHRKASVVAEKTLSICGRCDQLFVGDGVGICADCRRKQKKKMQAIY